LILLNFSCFQLFLQQFEDLQILAATTQEREVRRVFGSKGMEIYERRVTSMKKLLAMVLALVMTLSLAVSASAFKDDKDVSADYAEAVAVLNGMDVFKGYEDGSFKPTGNITRAEVATIIYRIYTGDVAKNDKSGLYSTYNKFSDMTGAGWAAGYIGYCANAELVKGYPDGTFKPSGNVTGYEVLAMILRAVGYDKNGEFSGADWSLNVAKYAEQLGVLKNVAKTTNLGAPATRELVAEILFRAIQQPMVTYTPAFGYVTDKVANIAQNTLAKKNFNLDSKDSEDKWGRPSTKWYNTKTSKTYAEVVATPDASYNVATAQCDICSALGEKTSAKIVETYTNGVKSTAAETYKATATKAMVGAQGEQIEFYEVKDGYRLVIIDTYLARVDKVVEEETDKGGHVTQDDYIKMTAFAPSGAKFESPIYAEGNDYAKDAYVLVNVNEAKANNVEFVGLKGEQNYVEVVGAADSVVAAQTIVWRNANQHTLDGKEYDDAVMLALNEAGTTKDVKYTWFFDQFGNVIGSVGLDRSSYAVLKDLTWVGTGKNGHAEATLITFDGSATEKTVTVNKIDGFDSATHYKWVEDQKGAVPYLRDNRGNGFEVAGSKAYAQVGEDDGSNTYYLGLALYSVETLDDDSVNLKGIDYVDAVEKATLNVKTGAIIYGANNSKVFVTDDTQFIVRTEDAKGNYKYEAFTGTDKLAKMADGTIDVMFSEKDSKNVVDYVYITEYTPAELNAHLLYTFETQYSVNEKENKYGMKVILDGKEETVYTHNEDIMKALSDGQNMLYKVTIDTNTAHDTYGEILSIDLINEATDGTIDSTDKVYVDYVTGGAELSGKRILVGYEAYTVNEDTKVVLADGTVGTIADLKAKDVETKGIWVVHDNKAAPTASCVYVGEKLGDEAAATVYVNGVAVKFEQAATPFSATVTGDLGAAAKVTAKADDKNAVVTIANGANSFDTNHSATVTVVSEDGTAKNVYTVTLAPKATVAAAITKVKGVDVTANGNDATQHPMYQVTLSTDLNSTYFTASDISYQGDNVKKVELVVLDKAGNFAMVDGAPQIATDKVAATEINNEYWICSLITLDSGEHYAAWIQIVEGL
jgi:hypothetical protein